MPLNAEQTAALEAVKSGQNIFLTGPAGSGKSFLIREMSAWAEREDKKFALTALTGCAALLLGKKAKTLHSWAGIGLGRESAETLASKISKSYFKKRNWKSTQILVVDEISMMTPELFEKLDVIGKYVRKSNKPWGGIQLVLCGDFFQLPPVSKGISGESTPGRFAFESASWLSSKLQPFLLQTIERQTDPAFQKLLNECRIGEVSKETIDVLKSRQGLDWKSKLIRPTLLFSRNADVDMVNERNITALDKPLRIFDVQTSVMRDPEFTEVPIPVGEELDRIVAKLDNDANYVSRLELCVGAQVMLLMNKDMELGLVNGSRGVILDFEAETGLPIVQFLHGEPLVIQKNEWRSNECPHVARLQIPLRVAYAITIHKSQGATLDSALVDIGSSTFEYGQAYVALSRVRNLESLYIHTLEASKIRAHPSVVNFYMRLYETGVPVPSLESTTKTWETLLKEWSSSAVGRECLAKVSQRRSEAVVYPPESHVFEALHLTPLQNVRVVILGQDPYHGAGQAHGLSFSVLRGALPPSLVNIRKEFLSDLGASVSDADWERSNGNLTPWAMQGVLLLNAVLSVEEKKPDSHAKFGWEDLTQRLLELVIEAHAEDPLVFVAWGKKAQNIVYRLKMGKKHVIHAGVHPSPLSASSGFFGSKPFSKVNAALVSHGAAPIEWRLSTTASATNAVVVGGAGTMEDPV